MMSGNASEPVVVVVSPDVVDGEPALVVVVGASGWVDVEVAAPPPVQATAMPIKTIKTTRLITEQ
jgi:hypothetical protein